MATAHGAGGEVEQLLVGVAFPERRVLGRDLPDGGAGVTHHRALVIIQRRSNRAFAGNAIPGVGDGEPPLDWRTLEDHGIEHLGLIREAVVHGVSLVCNGEWRHSPFQSLHGYSKASTRICPQECRDGDLAKGHKFRKLHDLIHTGKGQWTGAGADCERLCGFPVNGSGLEL